MSSILTITGETHNDCNVMDIEDLLGKPYKEHGRGNGGYDCYGIAIEVERRLGHYLRDVLYTTHDLELSGLAPTLGLYPVNRIERGTVIEIEAKGELHIAVALDDRLMIHATYDRGVCVHPIKAFNVRGIYGFGLCV